MCFTPAASQPDQRMDTGIGTLLFYINARNKEVLVKRFIIYFFTTEMKIKRFIIHRFLSR